VLDELQELTVRPPHETSVFIPGPVALESIPGQVFQNDDVGLWMHRVRVVRSFVVDLLQGAIPTFSKEATCFRVMPEEFPGSWVTIAPGATANVLFKAKGAGDNAMSQEFDTVLAHMMQVLVVLNPENFVA
jgi:hypothetical protein